MLVKIDNIEGELIKDNETYALNTKCSTIC